MSTSPFFIFFLNIWDFSMCSTSKWPQLNSFLRKKNHPPCNIWAMGLLVGRPKLHTSRHRIRPQHLTIQTLPQYVKIAMLGRTFMTSRSHGVSMILILFFAQHSYIYSWLSGRFEQCLNSFRFTLKPENG